MPGTSRVLLGISVGTLSGGHAGPSEGLLGPQKAFLGAKSAPNHKKSLKRASRSGTTRVLVTISSEMRDVTEAQFLAFDANRLRYSADTDAGTLTVRSPAGDFLYQCPLSEVPGIISSDAKARRTALHRVMQTIVSSARIATGGGVARIVLMNGVTGDAKVDLGGKLLNLAADRPVRLPDGGMAFEVTRFTGPRASMCSLEGAVVLERTTFSKDAARQRVDGLLE